MPDEKLITIWFSDNVPACIEAECYGELAIHPAIVQTPDDDFMFESHVWAVTHINTGLALGLYYTKKVALAALREWKKLGDWSFGYGNKLAFDRMNRKVAEKKRIYKKYPQVDWIKSDKANFCEMSSELGSPCVALQADLEAENQIILDWPDLKTLSPNARVHWRTRNASQRGQKTMAYFLAKEAGLSLNKGVLYQLHWVFHPPDNRHRDDDNLEASMKGARDGICAAAGIDDSQIRRTIKDMGTPSKPPYVSAEFEVLADARPE